MCRFFLFFLLLFAIPESDAQDSLRNSHWRVISVERADTPSDDFTITESRDDGSATTRCTLDSIQFTNSRAIFYVGSEAARVMHRLNARTSRLPRGKDGRFRLTMLGQERDAWYTIDGERVVITIEDSEDAPLVIKAETFSQHPIAQ